MVERLKFSARQFIKENGRSIADSLTLSRVVGAPFIAGLHLTGDRQNATRMHALLSATDVIDGWIARRSKEGATKDGASNDNEADKVFSLAVEASLAATGDLPVSHLAARFIRDGVMILARKHYMSLGIDTKAKAGKLSTFIVACADTVVPTMRDPHSKKVVNRFATGSKVLTGIYNLYSWHKDSQKLLQRAQADS